MKNTIHKTAIVDKKIKLGNNVAIGPYSVIGPNVQIKNNVKIHSQVNIQGHTIIDEDTEIFPFASIGTIPQDLKFHGEKSKLIIGGDEATFNYVKIMDIAPIDYTILGEGENPMREMCLKLKNTVSGIS